MAVYADVGVDIVANFNFAFHTKLDSFFSSNRHAQLLCTFESTS